VRARSERTKNVLFVLWKTREQLSKCSGDGSGPIGTTRPIPPNRRSCLGCIRWKDMSNPKRLRWNIVLTETYESRSAITNLSWLENKHYSILFYSILFYSYLNILNNTHSELLGQFRLTGDRAKYSMYNVYSIQCTDGYVTMWEVIPNSRWRAPSYIREMVWCSPLSDEFRLGSGRVTKMYFQC